MEKSLIILVLGLAILGGLFLYKRSGRGSRSSLLMNDASDLGEATELSLVGDSSGDAGLDFSSDVTDSLDEDVLSEEVSPAEITPISYQVELETTLGSIVVSLNRDETPNTVQNFLKLTREGFYDGTIFHRVIDGFMIQGGCPEGTGRGGPGYKFNDEPFSGEYERGVLAMANSGPNTNGSQFFIMHETTPLPKDYVIFGRVTKGMEVVDAIATAPVERSLSGEVSKPVDPVKVISARSL